jgi:hypothetical protein
VSIGAVTVERTDATTVVTVARIGVKIGATNPTVHPAHARRSAVIRGG